VDGVGKNIHSFIHSPQVNLFSDVLDFFSKSLELFNRSTDSFIIWWPTSGPQVLFPEMFKFAKIQDGGCRPAAILDFFQIPITFESLDRFFQNLVPTAEPQGILSALFIFKNPNCWLQDGSHLEF
jgi:hypothetical protein